MALLRTHNGCLNSPKAWSAALFSSFERRFNYAAAAAARLGYSRGLARRRQAQVKAVCRGCGHELPRSMRSFVLPEEEAPDGGSNGVRLRRHYLSKPAAYATRLLQRFIPMPTKPRIIRASVVGSGTDEISLTVVVTLPGVP